MNDLHQYQVKYKRQIRSSIIFSTQNQKKDSSLQKKLYICIIFSSLVLLFATYLITKKCEFGYNVPCNPFFGSFYNVVAQERPNGIDEAAFLCIFRFVCIEGVLIFLLFNCSKRKELIYYSIIFIGTIFLAYNSCEWLNKARDSFRENNNIILEKVDNTSNQIYFVMMEDQGDYCVQPKYLQYALIDRPITVISEEEINSIKPNAWVLTNKEYKIADFGEIIVSSDNMNLYKVNND